MAEGRDEYQAQSHGCRKRNSSKPLKACILNDFCCVSPTEVAKGARCNKALVWLLVEVYSVGSSMPILRLVLFVDELGRVLWTTPNCIFCGSMHCFLSQDTEKQGVKSYKMICSAVLTGLNNSECSKCQQRQSLSGIFHDCKDASCGGSVRGKSCKKPDLMWMKKSWTCELMHSAKATSFTVRFLWMRPALCFFACRHRPVKCS